MQDDILEATMTPLEILLFTAKLKIHESEEIIEKKVSKMLKDLNLLNCKNTRIGNNFFRGVSGGERKRTSIAMELISDPKIVFLDEPTTGLDSFNAHEVIQNICRLAKLKQKVVIFTIHQPSSEIFNLLDKILVLADGRTTFFGPRNECINFFDGNLKLQYPGNYNPFEYFIEMTTFDVINNNKVKGIKAYNEILSDFKNEENNNNNKEIKSDRSIKSNKTFNDNLDNKKLENYSRYIELLSDIFIGRKILVEENGEIEQKENKEFVEKFGDKNNEENFDAKKKEELDLLIKEKQKTKGFCYELNLLFGRIMIMSVRNSQRLFFKCMSTLVTALFCCILFTNVSLNKFFIIPLLSFSFNFNIIY